MSIYNEQIKLKNLKKARKKKGLTQQKLADLAQTTKSSISDYEKGKAAPRADTLVNIAKALDVSLDWLCGFTEEYSYIQNVVSSFILILDVCKPSIAINNNIVSLTFDTDTKDISSKEIFDFIDKYKSLMTFRDNKNVDVTTYEGIRDDLLKRYKDLPKYPDNNVLKEFDD